MEDSKLFIIITAVFVFIVGIIGYLVILIFWPEWVGVHGKKANEVESEHQDPKN